MMPARRTNPRVCRERARAHRSFDAENATLEHGAHVHDPSETIEIARSIGAL
jgi:hypothetical protein